GIRVEDTNLISASADGRGGHGAGGNIKLDAGPGQLTILTTSPSANSFNVDAQGAGANDQGGTITLVGTPVILDEDPLVLSANGVNGGSGGTITVKAQGPNSFVLVDDDTNGYVISATSGSRGGNGGIVNLSAGGDILINAAFLNAGVQSPELNNGNGAQYNL